MNLFETVTSEFYNLFDDEPPYVVRAPGRVNLIGEHTDYNEGFVLPMAIDRAIWIAFRPRHDNRVLLHSLQIQQPVDFSLDKVEHVPGWVEYVHGMAWSLKQDGYTLSGFEGVLSGDIPVGAGLSSSAALEMAAAKAFSLVSGWQFEPVLMAQIGQRAENQWVGARTGIMDQMISASGKAGHAFLLDCRDLSSRHIPMPGHTTVVIMDTATRHSHTDSGYNQRRIECEIAAAYFGVSHLRDVTWETFQAGSSDLAQKPRQRARHVLTENKRVLEASKALCAGDAERMGKLMNASHVSMRDDFEITNDELNLIVKLAQEQPGCYGARMTGGGFGGCGVALVDTSAVRTFAHNVAETYQSQTNLQPKVYLTQAANGAEALTKPPP